MRPLLILAGVNGAIGVAMGALSAHSLRGTSFESGIEFIRTGSDYQLWHAAALLGVDALTQRWPGRLNILVGWCLGLGALIFAGALYALAILGMSFLGAVVPVGGALMILGWVLLIIVGGRAMTIGETSS